MENVVEGMLHLDAEAEKERILRFIQEYVSPDDVVAIAVSGGMDSDLVARLCCESLGKDRVRLFIVVQDEMESKFLKNARNLAEDLDVSLAEIHLEKANHTLIAALECGEHGHIFRTDKELDTAKAKCSVRSSVISCYQDKGFLIAGTTNRSEKELGFFLTFGDNICHFKPISHLYKSQLYAIAELVGTRQEVICQESSAGFWPGQTDREDLAYWIVNDGPIIYPRDFSNEENSTVQQIQSALSYVKIDMFLMLYSTGMSPSAISGKIDLDSRITEGLAHIVEKAKRLKSRPILVEIQI